MAESECSGFSFFDSKPKSDSSTANNDSWCLQFSSGSFKFNSGSSNQRRRSRKVRLTSNSKSSSRASDSSRFVGKENNTSCEVHFPLVPFGIGVQNKIAKEANREPLTTSLIKISSILKGIPQNPHFYQLRNHSELSRNVLQSAWDQIFEESVDQIHSLRVEDFWARAKELWKTMGELQTMGYNVISLRKRMLELSDVMTELKSSESKVKGLKIKAEIHGLERNRLHFAIEREHQGMAMALGQAEEMEKQLPKYHGIFAKLARKPL